MKPRFLTITTLIFISAMTRLVPHPWNFTPIAAMALFSGAQFKNFKISALVPLCALLLGDLFLGFHNTMPFVYGAFLLMVLLGSLIQHKQTTSTIFLATLASSFSFFFITNFGVWLVSGIYSQTLKGLMECLIAAIPFYRMTLMGDFFYTAVLFGSFALIQKAVPALKEPSFSIV